MFAVLWPSHWQHSAGRQVKCNKSFSGAFIQTTDLNVWTAIIARTENSAMKGKRRSSEPHQPFAQIFAPPGKISAVCGAFMNIYAIVLHTRSPWRSQLTFHAKYFITKQVLHIWKCVCLSIPTLQGVSQSQQQKSALQAICLHSWQGS